MKNYLLLVLLGLSLCFTNCKAQNKLQNTMSYTYADGNNNRYYVSTNKIKYSPVKPKDSSSGTYNGGDPKEVEISKEEFKTVSSLLDQALDNSSNKNNKRTMGSSRIYRKVGETSSSCIIPYRSTTKTVIEKELKALLNGE